MYTSNGQMYVAVFRCNKDSASQYNIKSTEGKISNKKTFALKPINTYLFNTVMNNRLRLLIFWLHKKGEHLIKKLIVTKGLTSIQVINIYKQ